VKVIEYYRSRNPVIVGYDFHSEGGAWRSIYRYSRFLEASCRPVLLIDRRAQFTFRRLVLAVLFCRNIIMNGLGVFYRWEGVLACIARRDALVYLHDTAFMLDAFAAAHPLKSLCMSWVLRRNRVLCVSEQMRSLLEERYGSCKAVVVHEVVSVPEALEAGPCNVNIVMVGSIDERKGAPLFAAVAELAKASGLNWGFHWVGSLGSRSLGRLSEAVRWWGWQDNPTEFLKRADVFFLSSIDDPQPLACLEAMAHGCRCVVYRKTGSSELVDGVGGCAVFEEYTAAAAFACLQQVLEREPDRVALKLVVDRYCSVRAFAARVDPLLTGKE
jgi:glycosyltransferase involved in cell wall biosynthesis